MTRAQSTMTCEPPLTIKEASEAKRLTSAAGVGRPIRARIDGGRTRRTEPVKDAGPCHHTLDLEEQLIAKRLLKRVLVRPSVCE
jgi:hypothetical protein